MFQNRFFRRAAALVLTLALAAAAALPGLAAYPMPIQTASETEAVYLFNADTGKTILAQNADQQQYVASLTKMMTALLLLESGKDLNGEVTVPTAMTQEFKDIQNANGMTAGLRIGETVRRIDLLYALLVSSANDAASVIAYDVGGSVLDFVRQMNARAAELGCTGTNFTCAHGLFDYGNVSTAEDMARIAAECYKNPTFVQVSGTAAYTMPATNLHQNERTINSTNPLTDTGSEFYRSYIKCVKGGFTTLAGRCAVAFAEQGGHTYGLVILHADNASLYTECDQLLDWAFESFSDRPLVDTQTELTTVDLTKCRAQPTAALYAAAPVSGYGHADDVVSYAFDLPESIPATVKNGQKVGTATVYLDGYEVGTVDLVTHAEYISDFRTDSKATLLLLCTLVVILGALTVLTLAAGGGSLNLRRRKRRH
ncbi:MAG TPA: D-alanyl-D-alanine carboxypeptidase [Faecalibacterium sp.]|uniref:D-alanyl-D-alanine carboxypeptidase family protein n=1 Tax=Faecalibacterium prausnitzii TaxID=853 RepID=UPI000E940DA5|nr:D-alanyl-D-alanine carboxypeptidase family protein [Faecalibacterium prausnitzii]HAQ95657.1 D-alanyl-D-alanine carboxypeptidase [Faecalibacterium sp.]